MKDAFVFGSRPLPDSFPQGHEGRRHYRDYYQANGFGDGGVICSAMDLAKFYKALFIEKRLLQRSTLAEMLTDPIGESYGMGILVDGDLLGHSGGDLGFSGNVVINRSTGAIGIVLAASSAADTEWAYEAVE